MSEGMEVKLLLTKPREMDEANRELNMVEGIAVI